MKLNNQHSYYYKNYIKMKQKADMIKYPLVCIRMLEVVLKVYF